MSLWHAHAGLTWVWCNFTAFQDVKEAFATWLYVALRGRVAWMASQDVERGLLPACCSEVGVFLCGPAIPGVRHHKE